MDVIATRHERVVLDLEDRFTQQMIAAAGATKLLDRELGSLSGSAVRSNRSLSDSDRQISKTGKSAETSGKQIDRLSGRLALLAQAAAVLGPALVPIGAAAIPAIAGMSAEMMTAAAAAGVAVLAFKGLGDGLKALNAYQLAPTSKNLQKMRLEMQKLGPDGAHFVRFLDDLTPQLSELQQIARHGIFPGAETGITHLLTLLPQVKNIVGDLAGAMGQLAAEGGAGLAGPRFREFFDYLEREAQPLLIDLGHTVGNLADGFAAMAVAFGPISSDFAGGLEHMTAAFADWAHGLQSSDSFQSFLDYVQTNGPRVLDLLGALGDLFVQIVEAAAPVGAVTVPALTALLKVVTTLVDSPLGPTFIVAASALSLYSRGAVIAEKASVKLGIANSTGLARFNALTSAAKQAGAGLGLVALSMTDLDDKAGVSNTAMLALTGSFLGPWGAAAGAAIGLTMDLAAANDELEAAISRANRALDSGDMSQQRAALKSLRADVDATNGPVRNLGDVWQKAMSWISDSSTRTELHAQSALTELQIHLKNTGDIANLLTGPLGLTNDQLDALGYNAQRASKWLGHLNGVLDQRAAWSSYEAAIDAVKKALDDNGATLDKNTAAGRANRAVLDEIARSAGAVADNLKGADRADYLAHARKSFVDAADKLGMTRKAAEHLADRLGLLDATKAKPTVDLQDTPAKDKLAKVARNLDVFGKTKKTAKADVDAHNAFAELYKLDHVKLHDKTLTVHVGVTGGGSVGIAASPSTFDPVYNPNNYSSGGFTGKGGKFEPAGIVHRGEVVLPQEVVKADWSMLKSRYGYLPGFATGGLAGAPHLPVPPHNPAFEGSHHALQAVLEGLQFFADHLHLSGKLMHERFRELHHEAMQELKDRTDMLSLMRDEKQAMRDRLKALKDERKQTAQQVAGNFMHDITQGIDLVEAYRTGMLQFTSDQLPLVTDANGQITAESVQQYLSTLSPSQLANLQAQAGLGQMKADTRDAKAFLDALKDAVKHGLHGALLQQLAASGNLELVKQFAAMSKEDIAVYEQAFQSNQQAANMAGQYVGGQLYDQKIDKQLAENRQMNKHLAHLRAEIHELQKAVKIEGPKATGKAVGDEIKGAVTHGQRGGK